MDSTDKDNQNVLDSNHASNATKLGEVSEFEKSLGIESVQDNQVKKAAEVSNPSEDLHDFEQHIQDSVVDYQEGDLITGVVTKVEKSGICIDINFKSEGFVTSAELGEDENWNIGDDIKVVIDKLENKKGHTVLSRKKALYEENWEALTIAAQNKDNLTVKVNSNVKGGLIVSYQEIKGFIPASQLDDNETDYSELKGKTLDVAVLQADRKRRKVIFSQKKSFKDNDNKPSVDLDSFEMGQVRVGRITSVKDFGVFVDLGGIEGLVHISELSWGRISHPSEVVNVGEELDVFVLGVNKATSRISLGVKQLQPDPWVEASQKFSVGDTVEVKISRVVTFGAFAELNNQLEGLIHISEISHDHIPEINDVIKKEETYQVKIIKISPEEQKIGLSIKQLLSKNF